MRKIPLAAVEAGMVLAQPVVNAKGVTLAGAGTELNDRLVARFEGMDVEEVFIETDESVDAKQAEELKKKIEARFAFTGESKPWKDLLEVLTGRIDERVS